MVGEFYLSSWLHPSTFSYNFRWWGCSCSLLGSEWHYDLPFLVNLGEGSERNWPWVCLNLKLFFCFFFLNLPLSKKSSSHKGHNSWPLIFNYLHAKHRNYKIFKTCQHTWPFPHSYKKQWGIVALGLPFHTRRIHVVCNQVYMTKCD
jgi:hypothetical protein